MSGLTKQLIDELTVKDNTFGGLAVEVNMAQIVSVQNLDQLIQVQQVSNINFAVNLLRSIEPVFASFQNLRALDLSINHITTIANLESCINLVELNLSKNQIQFIENLETLQGLKVLNLSMNKIVRMKNLEHQPNLERLLIYGNQIEFLEGLNTMQNLKELLINRNRIKSLNYLSMPNMQSLVKLNACHNEISEAELENVAHVTLALYNLKQLDLYGNDVSNNPGYKFRITENSSLEKLDGLDVKGVIKDRLDRLRKDWQVNQMIEETSLEANKWIEAEREIKSVALAILAKKQERITNEFDSYKKSVDDDVLKFMEHIADLKNQRNQGKGDKITFDDLQTWRANVEYSENKRITLLESQLRQLEVKRKENIEEAVTSTNFLDKLYEISMEKPDVWTMMKQSEYSQAKRDGRGSQSMSLGASPAKTGTIAQNQKQLDAMMRMGQKALGSKLRNNVNEETEQARDDFEDLRKIENAAENRPKHNSKFISGDANRSGGAQARAPLNPMTPHNHELEDSGSVPNLKTRIQSSFIEQFKSDKPIAQQQDFTGSKRQPIPIMGIGNDFGGGYSGGQAVRQTSNAQGIRVSQELPAEDPDNKTKNCSIF